METQSACKRDAELASLGAWPFSIPAPWRIGRNYGRAAGGALSWSEGAGIPPDQRLAATDRQWGGLELGQAGGWAETRGSPRAVGRPSPTVPDRPGVAALLFEALSKTPV